MTLLLNDLFGIQARGGCSCAPMIGLFSMGVGLKLSYRIREGILAGYESLKVGYVRVNFNYFIEDGKINFLLNL